MCTIVALYRVHPRFPVVIAANRDEHYVRPSSGPQRSGDPPAALAGRDLRAGGTWFGVNAGGVAVAIADQGLAPDGLPRRSRGLLVLDALACRSVEAVDALLDALDPAAYNPCTLLYASAEAARLTAIGTPSPARRPLRPGLHVMVSGIGAQHARAREERVRATLDVAPLATLTPAALRATLESLLRGHDTRPGADDALCRHGAAAGTVSSFVALLAHDPSESVLYCATGAPCTADYRDYTALLQAIQPAAPAS